MTKLLLILGTAAILLGGCGGGGSATTTKADFQQEASAVCQQAFEQFTVRLEELSKEHEGERLTPEQRAKISQEELILPTYAEMVHGLEGLDLPSEETAAFEAFVSAFAGALEKGERDPSLLAEGHTVEPPREHAKAVGIPACAKL